MHLVDLLSSLKHDYIVNSPMNSYPEEKNVPSLVHSAQIKLMPNKWYHPNLIGWSIITNQAERGLVRVNKVIEYGLKVLLFCKKIK